jgi:glyoxylase-like metal-dependent hydrolase (beta-lactamase superfamily II)
VVLVDAGMDSDGADVQAGLDALGAVPGQVCAILLTHWHNDHTAGAQWIRERSGAPVFFHPGDERYFTGVGGATGLRKWLSDQIPELGVMVLAKGLLGESTPRPVRADTYVNDGDVVMELFDVIATPGHTNGHVSYFYRPERALFAGDALAVIDGRIRFMARPVTLDLNSARHSLSRCLDTQPALVCPGHREPLIDNVPRAVEEMRKYLASGGRWPLLG